MTAAIDFSPFDQRCKELLEALPKRYSKICFRSALYHLECANKIANIDPAMAAFRGLTAEEEAASGFMHCLKERGYANADKLLPKNHVHKNAIAPFLDVLGMFFAETIAAHVKRPALFFDGEGTECRMVLGLLIDVDGQDQWVHPVPPLNFTVRSGDKALSFRRQIDALVEHRGEKDIAAHIRTQANLRNKLLYASPEGFPGEIEMSSDFFESRRVRVMTLIRGYLLVQPYPELLSFVQDSLDAFLTMIGALKESDLHDNV